jgi:hypothetical protein
MTRLEKWHADGVVEITMADVAQQEAATGSAARARKTHRIIFTVSMYSDDADPMLQRIERVLFPDGARDENQRNDARIVFHAWRNRCTLVTNDGGSRSQPGGILGHREELAQLGVTVVSDAEAVAWVEDEIRQRDERLRRMHRDFGRPLPSWMGED